MRYLHKLNKFYLSSQSLSTKRHLCLLTGVSTCCY